MAGKVITVAQQKGGAGKTTLAANLAVAFARAGHRTALIDTDPQGSLGRWFMTRRESIEPGMEFSTASAWGVGYECDKLRKQADIILVDTPPKVDSDLRPALRESDLLLIPVATSKVDLWATESILDMAQRVDRPVMLVLNRFKARTTVSEEVMAEIDRLGAPRANAVIGNRIVYARTMGDGRGVLEEARGAWSSELEALTQEIAGEIGL
ncbi:ParA family partition ATPase [Profundibacterium mesophilum]|uniref:Cobyrinic acid ac-diamide synthase n=1 Tax=Profundibacterium mesophilum KAUST100406-0324 TaxID=1037889 RepID=A0A921NXD3_9RHOB|nr:ParA family partition ATPase [Profundibacterium mesophilum]KAF0675263.1 Cobyrinic acid ac-diamide synthase [Profundibacterium mesophilum KAUST100406-0324]